MLLPLFWDILDVFWGQVCGPLKPFSPERFCQVPGNLTPWESQVPQPPRTVERGWYLGLATLPGEIVMQAHSCWRHCPHHNGHPLTGLALLFVVWKGFLKALPCSMMRFCSDVWQNFYLSLYLQALLLRFSPLDIMLRRSRKIYLKIDKDQVGSACANFNMATKSLGDIFPENRGLDHVRSYETYASCRKCSAR